MLKVIGPICVNACICFYSTTKEKTLTMCFGFFCFLKHNIQICHQLLCLLEWFTKSGFAVLHANLLGILEITLYQQVYNFSSRVNWSVTVLLIKRLTETSKTFQVSKLETSSYEVIVRCQNKHFPLVHTFCHWIKIVILWLTLKTPPLSVSCTWKAHCVGKLCVRHSQVHISKTKY